MDRTEAAPVTAPQSQSRLSPVLFWALIAALLFRVVTAVLDRSAQAPAGGLVQWRPREEAAALARASGKPILYDFTAAWCGPCHLLDKHWNESAVADKVNASFVPARVVDRQQEEGQNPRDIAELLTRYEITGFPTVVAAAADGRLIAKLEGYRGREALMQFLEASRAK